MELLEANKRLQATSQKGQVGSEENGSLKRQLDETRRQLESVTRQNEELQKSVESKGRQLEERESSLKNMDQQLKKRKEQLDKLESQLRQVSRCGGCRRLPAYFVPLISMF